MDKTMETAQRLARFKLQVKRTLGQTVDLERLTRDPGYARQRLAEIEEAAEDEELLVRLLQLRDLLLPAASAPSATPAAESTAAEPATPRTAPLRNYLQGARAW